MVQAGAHPMQGREVQRVAREGGRGEDVGRVDHVLCGERGEQEWVSLDHDALEGAAHLIGEVRVYQGCLKRGGGRRFVWER